MHINREHLTMEAEKINRMHNNDLKFEECNSTLQMFLFCVDKKNKGDEKFFREHVDRILDKIYFKIMYEQAIAHYKKKNYNEALICFNMLDKYKHPVTFHEKGRCYYYLNNNQEAIRNFSIATSLGHNKSYHNLATIYFREKKFILCIHAFTNYNNKSKYDYFLLALAHHELGLYCFMDPLYCLMGDYTYYFIANKYIADGKVNEAIQAFDVMISSDDIVVDLKLDVSVKIAELKDK